MGRSLAFGPAAHAGPAYLSAAPRLFPRAAPDRVRASSPRGRHAPTTHAARQPRPASPSTRSPPSAEQRPPPLLHLIFALARLAATTAASHARPRHRAPHLAGTRLRDRPSSPLNPPSRPQLRLLLAHLVLASVSREKLPLPGNLSPELWLSSPEHSAPWTSPLHPPSRSPFTRSSTARAR